MVYLIALIPALAWGSIGIVAKILGGTTEQKTLGSMSGFLIFSLVLFIIKQPVITPIIFFIGFASGFFLSIANFGQFDGMNELGVSKAVPLVAAGQLTTNTILAAFLFKEWQNSSQWIFGIISLFLIIYGAKLISFKEVESTTKDKQNKKGYMGILMAVIGGSLYSLIPKGYQFYSNIGADSNYVFSLLLPQAIGGLLGAFIIYFIREKKSPLLEYRSKYTFKNLTIGLLWATGNIFLLISSMGSLGLATAFTFSQLNLLVGGIGGIVILKEEKTNKEMKLFICGLALVLAGAIIISRL